MYYINEVRDFKVIIMLKDGFTIYIPFDEGNSDYQTYLKWLAEGNEAAEWNTEETE
jgi:hypothetical protein